MRVLFWRTRFSYRIYSRAVKFWGGPKLKNIGWCWHLSESFIYDDHSYLDDCPKYVADEELSYWED